MAPTKYRILTGLVVLAASQSASAAPPTAGPERTVQRYLDLVAAGDHAKAYALVSAQDRAAISLEDFSKKKGTQLKVLGARNLSAEVAVEVVGPDPEALEKYISELMSELLPPEEAKRRLRAALASGRFSRARTTVYYLAVFEDGEWRVVTGHAARKRLAEQTEDQGGLVSVQEAMRSMPALRARTQANEALVTELEDLRRQNALLWRMNHDLKRRVAQAAAAAKDAPSAESDAEPSGGSTAGAADDTRRARYARLIKPTGPYSYDLDVELRQLDVKTIATQARIVPSFVNGKAAGFKLFGIRKGSIYEAMGFKNGDIVKVMNGIATLSPDAALRAFESIKTASQFEITVARGSGSVTLRYRMIE